MLTSCQTTRYVATELTDTATQSQETETETASATADSDTQSDTASVDTESDTESDTTSESSSATDIETDSSTADSSSATDSVSTDDSATQTAETDTPIDSESDSGADTDSDTEPDSESDTDTFCDLPTSFEWAASPAPLITPLPGDIAIKDPTVVFYDGEWHIYATAKPAANQWGLDYVHFADWADVASAEKVHASDNPRLQGYKAAPQLFQFSLDDKWYLIYQSPIPAFSTNAHPGNVNGWSEKQNLLFDLPSINGNSISGIDYWVICDDDTCYLFFSGTDGDVHHLYRTSTPKSMFPNGFQYDQIDVILQAQLPSGNDLLDASNVYKILGRNEYLLLVSALDDNGFRYFRAFRTENLGGDWAPWADTEMNAFASPYNVSGADWALDGVNHGEMLRANNDESMTINTCHLRYVFQGKTVSGIDYEHNEYSLGMLTDTRDTGKK
ncbi:MAG: hypothetical protein JXX14_19630 [Deltaproteobacteria bacterium]|nr:hypothetical protein [Deltaproteobacteria bacterium]